MPKTNRALMTIGEAAKAAGVAPTTLRYYEREGLVKPTARSAAGYRLYDREAAQRLRFIRSAQAVGFTLEDIGLLLELQTGDRRRCQSKVQKVLEARLKEVDHKLKELRRVRLALGDALDKCRGSSGECSVLEDLTPRKRKRR